LDCFSEHIRKMIRRLTPADAEAYAELRREALELEPHSFTSSPGDDRMRSIELVRDTLDSSSQAVFGALMPELVGTVGIQRLTRKKVAHKAELWGVYVRREYRRQGLGRQLIEAALEFARALDGVRQVHLRVTEKAASAAALYEKLGFAIWGTEPAGVCVDGEDLADWHMILRLGGR
jgi:ribosomal protein S18 acetylase RimI-like enzyme